MLSVPNPFRLFHPFFNLYTGGEQRPVFFDVDQTYPQLRIFEQHFEKIREELETILPERALMPRYHDVDAWQYKISGATQPGKDWKVFLLYAMGEKPEQNCQRVPFTAELLDQIPDLFQAFFSILDPGKSIPPHEGPYQGYLRYHLPMMIPRNNPPSIRIKDQHHTWKEKESILFDDSWEHEVINHSDEVRVVLIVDVFRPLPPLPHKFNMAMHYTFGKLYGKKLMRYFQT